MNKGLKNALLSLWVLTIAGLGIYFGGSTEGSTETMRTLSGASDSTQSSTPLLVENFDYNAGDLLTSKGWVAHSGAANNSVAVTTPGLDMTGYPGTGVGNATTINVTGEDVSKGFTPVTTGSVYSSFLGRVTASSTTAGYFFHFFSAADP